MTHPRPAQPVARSERLEDVPVASTVLDSADSHHTPPPPAFLLAQDFVPPARITAPPRLSERFPALYPLAVKVHQLRRHVTWLTSDAQWATANDRAEQPLAYRVLRHNSLLLRTLGDADLRLQHNKVTNLRLASARINRVVLRPGHTFSFNRIVGSATRRKGYVAGMRLSNGDAVSGVGGGICQLANLIHWMVLHSPLTVVERSEHSFDPFPDNGRVLPWGVGTSIVYNYVDLVIRNDTDITFEFLVEVGERYLEGELRCDRELPHSYRVYAKDEAFLRHEGRVFRRNEIWRRVIDRRTGRHVGDELLKQNCALVKYLPEGVPIYDV